MKPRVLSCAFLLLAAVLFLLPQTAQAECSASVLCPTGFNLFCSNPNASATCISTANSVDCGSGPSFCPVATCTASIRCADGTRIFCSGANSCAQGSWSIKCDQTVTYCPECVNAPWWAQCPAEFFEG